MDDLNNESEVRQAGWHRPRWVPAQSLARHAPGWPTLWRQAAWIRPAAKYQAAMSNLETDQALSQTDTTNRAQSSQQDKYVAGLCDVVSIGAGQKAESMAGTGDVATIQPAQGHQ